MAILLSFVELWTENSSSKFPLLYQLNANCRRRRLSTGTHSAPQTVSEFSPKALLISVSSTAWAHTHLVSINTHGMGSLSPQGQSLPQCDRFERLKWPIQKYVCKASTACMHYSYNQANPIDIIKKKHPTTAGSSSLCPTRAYHRILPHLQSSLHYFTSNSFYHLLLFHCYLPGHKTGFSLPRENNYGMLTLWFIWKGRTYTYNVPDPFICHLT